MIIISLAAALQSYLTLLSSPLLLCSYCDPHSLYVFLTLFNSTYIFPDSDGFIYKILACP